jgi:hypothetical protein
MGMKLKFSSAFTASTALNPKVVQDDALTDTGNGRQMKWGDLPGDGRADLANPMGFRVVAGSFQFEPRYECCHRIDVIADDPGTTTCCLD